MERHLFLSPYPNPANFFWSPSPKQAHFFCNYSGGCKAMYRTLLGVSIDELGHFNGAVLSRYPKY